MAAAGIYANEMRGGGALVTVDVGRIVMVRVIFTNWVMTRP